MKKIAGSGAGSVSQRYGSVPTCRGSETLVKKRGREKERKGKITKREEDKRKLAH
jgi:hypothetical protein